MTNALFDQLLEARLGDVPFPLTNLRTEVHQDHAEHAKPDQDGARIEATGRRPLLVSGRAVFNNYIVEGKSETWGGKPLYPEQHDAFMRVCADRATHDFTHPSRGTFKVKVVSAISTLDAERRGGEDVDFTLIETTESEFESDLILKKGSPLTDATIAAVNLDASLGLLDPDPRLSAPDDGRSLEDDMRAIQGVFDQVNLIGRQAVGIIRRLEYRLFAIEAAINRVGDVGAWPQKRDIAKMREGLRLAQGALGSLLGEVRIFVVPGRTTLGALASKLLNTPAELILLNPALVGKPQLEARTVLRYHKRAA